MHVPLLDLKPQLASLRPQLLEAVTRVLDSTGYILGPEVAAFEERVAAYCGVPHGIGVSSGTDALLAALMSLDIGPRDRVLTTPYSFFATMGVILRVGAAPVFVDIDPQSFNIDPAAAEAVLAEDRGHGGPIKAMIPVHLYGQCADMQPLLVLAERYGLAVIEDAAQAIGAECPFTNNGTISWHRAGSMGTCGCFSFFPSKNLGGIGDGGLVTTADKELDQILRANRNHGAEPKYYHSRVGGNFRLDPIQAAVLTIKLDYLERWHEGRRKNAARYRQLFFEAGLVDDPVVLPTEVYAGVAGADRHDAHIYNQFVILVPERDQLLKFLHAREIGCEIYYPLCLHQQECLRDPAYRAQSFPVAERAAATSLALPIFPELRDEQLAHVVETIKAFYHAG
ncbi:MAG: DegT/DnrJ/EryC1/StrS family aminotransferase [Desulfobulbus sp.]|jgi:dTDP-4-amino-4,6-dideoxygalactose transaminase